MKYDLIITKISKSNSKQLVARHLAAEPSISHNDALALLDKLPFVYLKKVSEEKMKHTKNQLERLGIVCIIRESSEASSENISGETKISEKKDTTYTIQEKKISFERLKPINEEKITFLSTNLPEHSEKRSRRKIKIIIVSILVLLLTFILLRSTNVNRTFTFQSQRNFKTTVTKKKENTSKNSPNNSLKKENKRGDNNKNLTLGNSQIEPLRVKKSKTFLDSAKLMSNDISKAIKFYKIALSFNRYNLVAWQGLLNAYQEANMWSEVEVTKNQIEEIFGNSIFTIEKIIEPYGDLNECSSSDNGFCRIGYISKSSKKRKIEKDTYLILQAVFTQRDCQKITLYASTGKGTGLLVHISKNNFPLKISDYLKKASITFVK